MSTSTTYRSVRWRGEAQASPSLSRLTKKQLIGIIAFAVVLILLGVGLIAYPYVSDYYSRLSQAKVTHSQDRVISETPVEDLTAEFDHTRDFNDRLIAGRVVVTDPFDPNNVTPTDAEYESVLNLAGDGVMGTIAIPKIDVFLPIYHGVEGENMEHGVGHMPSTTLPVGGPSTHAGLAGHTGLPSARIFDSLTKIHKGDWFILTILGEDMAYEVVSTEVVLPDETESLHVVEGEDLVTLITCTPYGVNTHRLLVHGQRCPIPNEWLKLQETVKKVPLIPQTVAETPKFIFTVLGLLAGLGMLAALAVFAHYRRKRAEEERDEGVEAEVTPTTPPLRPIPTMYAPGTQPAATSQRVTPGRRHGAAAQDTAPAAGRRSATAQDAAPAAGRRSPAAQDATPAAGRRSATAQQAAAAQPTASARSRMSSLIPFVGFEAEDDGLDISDDMPTAPQRVLTAPSSSSPAPGHARHAAAPASSASTSPRHASASTAPAPSGPRHARHAAPANGATQQVTTPRQTASSATPAPSGSRFRTAQQAATPRYGAATQQPASTPRHHASPAPEPHQQAGAVASPHQTATSATSAPSGSRFRTTQQVATPRHGAHFRSSSASTSSQAPAARTSQDTAAEAPQTSQPARPTKTSRRGAHFRK